jgi:hypothetical protein
MTTEPKAARFRGGESLKRPLKQHSDKIRERLRDFYMANGLSEQIANDSEEFDEAFSKAAGIDSAGEFANRIFAATDWAASMIQQMAEEINNEVLEAEYNELLRTLENASEKLKKISPRLDQLIHPNAEPENVAYQIEKIVDYIKTAKPFIEEMQRAKRPEQMKIPIAVEMIKQIFGVLEEYGFDPTAKENQSKIVKILQPIGTEICLDYDPQTWKRRIREAKTE